MLSKSPSRGEPVGAGSDQHHHLHLEDVGGICRDLGGPCCNVVACRQWGCQGRVDALAEGLSGVRAALDLCGLKR